MFSFFTKKNKVAGSYPGDRFRVDMHAHLVPGVDDGATDLEHAMKLVRGLVELGYTKLIATPHIYRDLYPNTLETLQPAAERLQEEMAKTLSGVEFHLAAEYMMDEYFASLLASKTPLLTIRENLVLVELPFMSLPMGWKEILFDLQIAGYKPVLAHPERYQYAQAQPQLFQEWIEAGCLLQMNVLSLGGYYGPAVQKAAKYLIKNKLVRLAGTDCHHERHLAAYRDPAVIQGLIDYEGWENQTLLS